MQSSREVLLLLRLISMPAECPCVIDAAPEHTMDGRHGDREMIAFLSTKACYSPASGEIVGISKTMDDEMKVSLKEAEDLTMGVQSMSGPPGDSMPQPSGLLRHPTMGVKRMSGPSGDSMPQPSRLLRRRIGNERPSD